MEIKPGQIYWHYKGGMYKIILLPKDSEGEDMEPMVVYEDMHDKSKIWVQSQERFLETIEWEGKTVPRFTIISDNVGDAQS